MSEDEQGELLHATLLCLLKPCCCQHWPLLPCHSGPDHCTYCRRHCVSSNQPTKKIPTLLKHSISLLGGTAVVVATTGCSSWLSQAGSVRCFAALPLTRLACSLVVI